MILLSIYIYSSFYRFFSRISHCRVLSEVPRVVRPLWLSILYIVACTCQSQPPNLPLPPCFSFGIRKFDFEICESASVSYTSSFVSFFQIPHMSESANICLSLSDLPPSLCSFFVANVIFLSHCSYCRGSCCHSEVLPDSSLQLDLCAKQQRHCPIKPGHLISPGRKGCYCIPRQHRGLLGAPGRRAAGAARPALRGDEQDGPRGPWCCGSGWRCHLRDMPSRQAGLGPVRKTLRVEFRKVILTVLIQNSMAGKTQVYIYIHFLGFLRYVSCSAMSVCLTLLWPHGL